MQFRQCPRVWKICTRPLSESGQEEDQLHALICQRALPSKRSCQSLPFAKGLIQFHGLKTPLYQGKCARGTPTNVTDTGNELRLLVDQQHQAVGSIMHSLLLWCAEILLGMDMVKQE